MAWSIFLKYVIRPALKINILYAYKTRQGFYATDFFDWFGNVAVQRCVCRGRAGGVAQGPDGGCGAEIFGPERI
jgi:hypothetical protein